MVLKYFWNLATGNWNSPKSGQPQPKNRLDHGLVQFGPTVFFGPMDWTCEHYPHPWTTLSPCKHHDTHPQRAMSTQDNDPIQQWQWAPSTTTHTQWWALTTEWRWMPTTIGQQAPTTTRLQATTIMYQHQHTQIWTRPQLHDAQTRMRAQHHDTQLGARVDCHNHHTSAQHQCTWVEMRHQHHDVQMGTRAQPHDTWWCTNIMRAQYHDTPMGVRAQHHSDEAKMKAWHPYPVTRTQHNSNEGHAWKVTRAQHQQHTWTGTNAQHHYPAMRGHQANYRRMWHVNRWWWPAILMDIIVVIICCHVKWIHFA